MMSPNLQMERISQSGISSVIGIYNHSIFYNNIPPKKMVYFSCTVFISDSELTSKSPFANQGASSLLQRHQRQNPTPGDFLERCYCGENIMLEHRDEADFLKLHIWHMFLEVSSRCWYLQK